MGSPPFRLNFSDLWEVGKVALMAGASGAFIALLQTLQSVQFGAWNPIITALLTILLKLAHQWAGDTRPKPPQA